MVLPTDTASFANYTDGAQPGARFDRAAGARHGAERRRRGRHRRRGSAACCRSSPTSHAHRAARSVRAAPADGLAADAVQHRQRLAIVAERRAAGRCRLTKAAVQRQSSRPKPAEPVLAQRPAEHLAGRSGPKARRSAGAAASATLVAAATRSRSSPRSRRPATRCGWPGQRAPVPGRRPTARSAWARTANGRIFSSADVGAAMQRIVTAHARQPRVRGRPGGDRDALDRCRD